MARRGARITGLDFSPVALAKAKELATHAGAEVTWVQADAARIPADLHGRCDLAYATIGAICWIEDISAWMRSAAATLRPGGHLVLVEIHPLLNMVAEPEPFSLDFPYASDRPHRFNEPGTRRPPCRARIERDRQLCPQPRRDRHGRDRSGLRIDSLTEHLEASRSPRPPLVPREADGRYRLRLEGQLLPILFTLPATKPDE